MNLFESKKQEQSGSRAYKTEERVRGEEYTIEKMMGGRENG